MYGTVAHLRVKSGMEERLIELFRAIEALKSPGLLAAHCYRMDTDKNDYYLAVVFASKELYFANAENPEVLAIDREMFTLLESEPEWHDGEVIYTKK
jgi:quinol monooxygenase YgiN